jgi:cyanophycin synthetase
MIKNPPIIKKVVEEMGGTIRKVIPERGYFYINISGEKIFVSRKFKISSNLISGGEITRFKDLTYIILKEAGLPTPKTVCIYRKNLSANHIDGKLGTLNLPLVIKDTKGSQSKGVFTNIKSLPEAKEIIKEQIKKFPSLVAQEMIFGKEFRILVLKNNVIGALELIPPRVFGDGKNTIKSLIDIKQKKLTQKTALNDSLVEILKEQGFSLESIPEKGKEVYIKKGSCLAEGGETRDVTDIVNEDIKNICIKATRTVGKYLSGIDIMCDDISKNISGQNFNIIEINGKPDLYIHYNPTHGKTRNVIKEIINFILELRKNE